MFAHFQRLPVAFHERYTSGRVISRQVSDVDSIADLFDDGLDSLVSAVFSLLLVGVGHAAARLAAGAGRAGRLDPAGLADGLVPARVGGGLPAQPGDHRPGHRALRGDVRRDQRGPGVPPGTAQRGDLRRPEPGLRGRRAALVPAARDLLPGDHPGRQPGHRRGAALRRAARDGRRHEGRRAGHVPAATCSGSSTRCRTCRSSTTRSSRRRRRWRRSPACWRRRPRCPSRPPSRASPRPARGQRRRGGREVRFEAVRFGYRGEVVLPGLRPDHPGRADRGAWSARPGPARPPSPGCSPGSTTRARAGSCSTGSTCGELSDAGAAARDHHDHPGELPVHRVDRGQHRARQAGRQPGGDPGRRRGHRRRHRSSPRCRTATTPRSASAAAGCRPGSASSSPSHGPSSPPRRCWSWTRRPRCSTSRASALVQDALHTILAGRTALIIAHRLSTVRSPTGCSSSTAASIIEDGPPARAAGRPAASTRPCTPAGRQSLA